MNQIGCSAMESSKKTRKIEAVKTALDLSPFEWKQYHPFTAGGRRYSMSARNVAGNIARELVKRFGAHRVVLFGSADRGDIHEKSDIDLAVWGIPPKDFYRAVAFASGYSKEWKVDLVDAEDCRESLRYSILKEGVVITSKIGALHFNSERDVIESGARAFGVCKISGEYGMSWPY